VTVHPRQVQVEKQNVGTRRFSRLAHSRHELYGLRAIGGDMEVVAKMVGSERLVPQKYVSPRLSSASRMCISLILCRPLADDTNDFFR
jgi:hypothetical protein